MQNLNNKNEEGNLNLPERPSEVKEDWTNFGKEGKGDSEKKELSSVDLDQEKKIEKELMQEVELMRADPNLTDQAAAKSKKIGFLGEKEKIEHLLQIAKEKGVEAAIRVVKEMNDPYLLDRLRDMLAESDYYQNFKK